jgi:hypothetical protein
MKIIKLKSSSKYFNEVVELLKIIDKEHNKKNNRFKIMKKRCESEIEECLVLVSSNNLIGTISLFSDKLTSSEHNLSHDMYIGSFFIKEEFRMMGYGKLLVNSINIPVYSISKLKSSLFGNKVKDILYNNQEYILYHRD